MAFRCCKATFACEDGHLGALELGSAPTYHVAREPHLPVAQRSGSHETPAHHRGWPSFVGVSLSPGDPEPRFRHAEGVSRSLSESEANSPVRNPFRSPYFKRRARNWRASRLRVNALASRPGRSRFAACVRRFATRACVHEGLSGWASGGARPSAWPTLAGVLADCLSAHRETSRPEKSLVHGSRGRNARTHKQPRRFGQNPDSAEAAEHGSLG
jgi:hypothetical protein